MSLLDVSRHESWMARAACAGSADPDLFFPASHAQAGKAIAICRRCPVCADCRRYARDHPRLARYGVWGGHLEGEPGDARTTRPRTR